MDDLTITRLCAEAMGYDLMDTSVHMPAHMLPYDPLHDDAQAMALVKKLHILVSWTPDDYWFISTDTGKHPTTNADLNRAICECVAKMQQAKEGK